MSGFFMLPDLHFTGGKRHWSDARRLPREGLALAFVESRNRLLAWLAPFGPTRRGWEVARQYDADPPLWTLGHVAWQAEWWCLRGVHDIKRRGVVVQVPAQPSLLDGADTWFDPDRIDPDARWDAVLPDVAVIKRYAADVLDGLLRQIAVLPDDSDATLYALRRALFHEDAQAEAVASLLQSLGLVPAEQASPQASASYPYAGMLQFPGGRFVQGWDEADGFAQPDELPAQPIYVPAFEIDSAPVSNAHFLEFMEDGGYERPAWWSAAGQQWLMMQERSAPRYWSRHPRIRSWQIERFGQVRTVNMDEPVRHVSLFEAQAWCAWAGRRLPDEAEWEMAAVQNRGGFHWGMVREWTATPYEPYAGFQAKAGDARYVSRFGSHQAVRGASFASADRARHPCARMALDPGSDIGFVGFRTCSL